MRCCSWMKPAIFGRLKCYSVSHAIPGRPARISCTAGDLESHGLFHQQRPPPGRPFQHSHRTPGRSSGSRSGIQYPWLAAALFTIYPVTLRYAAESRVYTQALFLSVVATLIYVRLAKTGARGLLAAYWLVLTAAIYTQPYSASVGLALLLWSVWHREFKTATYRGIAGALTALAFLPWYLWSRAAWTSGILREGFHFSASIKFPLMVFREVAGAGYWGSGLLFLLCAMAILRGAPRLRSLLLSL